MQSAASRNREGNFFINSTKSSRKLHENKFFSIIFSDSIVCLILPARAPTKREKCNVTRKNTVSCILAWFLCSRTMIISMAFNCICSCFALRLYLALKLKGNHLLFIFSKAVLQKERKEIRAELLFL